MEFTSDLSDNLTKGFVTLSNLKYLIASIFSDTLVPELETIGLKTHPSGKSNMIFHNGYVQNQIDKVMSSEGKRDYTISRISLSKYNKINIDIHIQKSGEKIQFYLAGPDLRNYYMYLPKLGPYPHTGTSNSKWYDIAYRTHMVSIAVNLKLLEIMLFGIRISDTYTVSTTGILGLEVPFDIPLVYQSVDILTDQKYLLNSSNPSKISDGMFLYGKNGVKSEDTDKILSQLRINFPHIENSVYPVVIRDWDLSEYVNSSYRFALCSWNRHARILIKSCKGCDVIIIDPWMNGLPRVISSVLAPANRKIRIGFFSRTIKDQEGEGSCVFCALSRLISLVDSTEIEQPEVSANKPVSDFYAYLVKTVYLLSK